ncbi:MAG: NAD(P)H-dependent oxidoreductase subunit E [Chloroflexi bacterium]|nr:NAD(P)H-dependent oxidoreductase subunit E [Chloroflexota bacterium]MDA8188191.1 NAD(P)H-dependent oxidoreductase subunit E [Dehalococcoidales bacterium]
MAAHSGDSTTKSPDLFKEILNKYVDEEGAVLPILKEMQEEYGYIPPDTLTPIADFLRLSPSQVYAVLSFYNEFTTEPPGQTVVHVCNGPACRIRGGLKVERAVRRALGIQPGETTSDGQFSLKTSACLGLCAHAPAIQVNHDLLGEVTLAKVQKVLQGQDIEDIRADGSH